jgi:phosphoribosylamine--glycine ligase
MKFLMVSLCGEGSHVLHYIQSEGNQVRLYVKEPESAAAWDGLLPKTRQINPDKDEIVIFDDSSMGNIADKLRKAGYFTVGASKFADRLEQDRDFGFEFMEKNGILIPLTQRFSSSDNVETFVRANEKKEDGSLRRFVFKASGKNLPSYLTYCALDSEDLISYVDWVMAHFKGKIESFVLQEFVDGVVVMSEMWCDGTKFVRPANHTLEVKAMMNGEKGPATGCSGNLVWAEYMPSRIVANGLAKVEAAIVAEGYVGSIDLNTVVNDEGVWGLEWTPRFGYDSTPTQMFLMRSGEIGKFFSDLARGQAGEQPLSEEIGAGIRFTIPPYPIEFEAKELAKVRPNIGIPIRGLTEKNEGSFYFYEVMLDEETGGLCHSPGDGILGVAMGRSRHVWDAFEQPYQALSELRIPELQYRTDLAEKLSCMFMEVAEQNSPALGTLASAE